MTTIHLRHSINRSPLRLGLVLVPLVLICFALLPRAQAQLMPTPGGSYPNDNTALGGITALFHLSTGSFNTALGVNSMWLNNTGNNNTAVGDSALKRNTSGNNNTATGIQALFNNQTANNNTADGNVALFSNTTGTQNTATGTGALFSNTTGGFNTATGLNALRNNNGDDNVAVGWQALFNVTTGSDNIAVGVNAGFSITTGSENIIIGEIGGVADESNVTRIGNISSTPQDTGVMVTMDQVNGTKMGVVVVASSKRYKEDIKPMNKASEALFALKPVAFRYKADIDPDRAERYGLIAEEVEKVNPDLVVRDQNGRANVVRYNSVNAMLLNEFLKEHKKVEEQQASISQQQASISQLKREIRTMVAQVKEQAAQIQKVSAQLQVNKPAPQVVVNKP